MSDRRRISSSSSRSELKRGWRQFKLPCDSSNTDSQEKACCISGHARRKCKSCRGGNPKVHIVLNGPEVEQGEEQNDNCRQLHLVLVKEEYACM